MLKRGFLVSLGALVVAWGCGSSDEPGGGGNTGGFGAQNSVGGGFNFDGSMGTSSGGASGSSGGGDVGALRDAACAGWAAEPEPLPAVLDARGRRQRIDGEQCAGQQSKQMGDHSRCAGSGDGFALPASTAVGIIYYPNLGNTGAGTTPRPISACVNTNAMIPIDLLGAAGSAHRRPNRAVAAERQHRRRDADPRRVPAMPFRTA